METGHTRKLASYVAGLRFQDLPDVVVERAKWLILDILGCSLRGLSVETPDISFNILKEIGGKEEATVIGGKAKLPALHAAAINATAAWALHNDDTYLDGMNHPGHGVVAGGLAVAEKEHLSGSEFLVATVAAFEVSCRVAASINTDVEWGKGNLGWYCSISDPFCAAVAAGKLLKLNTEELCSAIGIAASAAAGITEIGLPPADASPIKGPAFWPWVAGHSTMLGIFAALLAQRGVRTSEISLESEKGYCRIFTNGHGNLDRLVAGLGHTYETLRIAIRRHCNSQVVQAPIDAAQSIVLKHNITPDAIEKIVIHSCNYPVMYLNTREIHSASMAVLNVPYGVALAVLNRKDMVLADQICDQLNDEVVTTFMRKIEVVEDPEMTEALTRNKWPAKAVITTKNGKVYEETVWHARGEFPENPLTEEEVLYKFRAYAGSSIGKSKSEQVIKAVNALEKMKDIGELADLIRGD